MNIGKLFLKESNGDIGAKHQGYLVAVLPPSTLLRVRFSRGYFAASMLINTLLFGFILKQRY